MILWRKPSFLFVIVCMAITHAEDDRNLERSPGFNFNITHVLYHSILLCGGAIICNKSLLTLFDIPNKTEPNSSRCRTCSCKERCLSPFSEEKCCPDVFFRHGLRECRNIKVLFTRANLKEVVASCPIGTNFTLSKECTKERSKVDILLHPPVTSGTTNISYINKYCAFCNNATLLEEWNVNFECGKNTDFNFLSSYQDIIDFAITQSCNLIHISPNSAQYCSKYYYQTIASCNVTGSWLFYDKQIEQACLSSYNASMGIFKNLFCAMCNPPSLETHLAIKQCENSSSIYKTACSFQPTIEASFPYKNYFCFLCNHGDNNAEYYTDVDFLSADEIYDENKEYPFQYKISFDFSDTHLKQYVNEVFRNSNQGNAPPLKQNLYIKENLLKCPTSVNEFPPIGAFPPGVHFGQQLPPSTPSFSFKSPSFSMIRFPAINITNVLQTGFAFSRHGACRPGSLLNYTIPLQKPCSCNVGCREDCCDDFAFTQPWICIDDRFNRNEDDQGKDYLAIGGCIEDQRLEHFCTDGNTSQFYQAFPVTTRYGETYVNLFCYLCNKKTPDKINIAENVTQELKVWPLKVTCDKYINYRNFQSLQTLINYFNRSLCVLSFLPHAGVSKCSKNCFKGQFSSIQSCNISGSWTTFNEDIKNACELTETFRFPMIKVGNNYYKNKFCSVCNPFHQLPFDGPCNDFLENSSVARACREFPDIKVCFPYKNIFCEMCNNNGSVSECYREIVFPPVIPGCCPRPIIPSSLPLKINSFRSTFTLAASDPQIPMTKQEYISCQHNQIFDDFQHTCRNLTCFSGKMLIKDTCISLLAVTSHLRYTLALKLDFFTFDRINATFKELMEYMRDQITNKINNLLDTNVFIEDIILMSLTSCTSVIADRSEVFVYLRVFLPSKVYRDGMEKTLIYLTESSTKWGQIGKGMTAWNASVLDINVSRSQQSLFLPSYLWTLDKEIHCFVLANELKHGPSLYRNVLVSPLLTCPQVILRDKEFGVDWKKIRTEYTFSAFSLSSHQLWSLEGGRIRVCVNDIPLLTKTLKSRVLQNDNSALRIVTLICTIISLLCLVITFITYCMFPILRTLPGINNMCLVVSLFLAQFLMIVRPSFSSTGLAIVSALSHFSWLSMFLWLQVCSFHMYRVFSAKSRSEFNGNQNRKIMIQYIFYAFGSSLLIVIINIFATLIVTEGENTGYDRVSTLMMYKLAFIVTLITPLCFVCVTNVMFYILTAYKIHSTPTIEKTTRNRVHFAIYVKLFSLTGLSWILQIIDTFVAFSVLSYFVAILNGLQGLFIFVSYVCNQRVWKLYKNKLHRFPVHSPNSTVTSKRETTSM